MRWPCQLPGVIRLDGRVTIGQKTIDGFQVTSPNLRRVANRESDIVEFYSFTRDGSRVRQNPAATAMPRYETPL
jgi:hypothetical protein